MNSYPLPVARWLYTFAGVFAAGIAGILLPRVGPHPALPLFMGGIALAACVRWGRRMWPAVFAAAAGIDLWMRQPLIASLSVGIGAVGASTSIAWLLERRGFDANFGHARDVPLFIFASALGMTLVPTFGLLGFRLAGETAVAIDALRWIRWWSNSATGVLLVGPMLVAVSRQSLAQFAEHWIEGVLWLLVVALCCAGALSFGSLSVGKPLTVALALLLVVVGAIRFGLVVAAFGALTISVAAGLSFTGGRGIYAGLDPLKGLANIWLFGAVLSGMGLIVTALLAERDRAARDRLRAEQRYAQIFDGSPQPLWVHDPETLQFLMVNEAAVRQYGWGRDEFLRRRVPELAAPGSPRVVPRSDSEDGTTPAPEPFETRHRTRDGRVLAVEVWMRSIDLEGRRAQLVFACDVTERRALGSALIDAISSEQRRIGQELHDGLGQELTGLALSARALATRAERERLPIAGSLAQLSVLATNCIQAARRIAQGVSPLSDTDGDLPAALEALAARSSFGGTVVYFRSRLETPLDLDLEVRNHLFRIIQEAVQNALKHARARSVQIELHAHARGLTLAVNDDGQGLPQAGSSERWFRHAHHALSRKFDRRQARRGEPRFRRRIGRLRTAGARGSLI